MKNFLITLVSLFVLVGCNSAQSDETETQGSADQNQPGNTSINDSISELNTKILKIEDQTNTLSRDIETQKAEIGNLKVSKANKYFGLIVSIPSTLIAVLIVAIYLLERRYSRLNHIIHSLHQQLYKPDRFEERLRRIENNIDSINRKIHTGQPSYNQDHEINSQLNNIEQRLQTLEHSNPNHQTEEPKSASQATNAYFGNLKRGSSGELFFNDVYNSCKDEAKFKATLNGNTGSFELIDLNLIKSNEANDPAFRSAEGSVPISDANSYKTITPGSVLRKEIANGVVIWVLKQPTIVKLTL